MKAKINKMIAASFALMLSACEDFVDVGLPPTQVTAEQVFNEPQLVEAALVQNYIALRDQVLLTGRQNGTGVTLGLYSDELVNWGSPAGNPQTFYTNTLSPQSNAIKAIWNDAYKVIYSCNRIIEGLAHASRIPEVDKNKLMAEALFIRGLVHFYIHQLFHEIPYVTSSDYKVNKTIQKVGKDEIYENIVTDLQEALIKIGDENSTSNVRPNKYVIKAFLARVFLYQNKWVEAFSQSTEVIESGRYSLAQNIEDVFLKNSSGTIWQFTPQSESVNTYEAQSMIFNTVPPPNFSISPALLASFEIGDLRKVKWLKGVGNDTNMQYHSYKYKEFLPSGISKEQSIVFRLEEMFYIGIEAGIYMGEVNQAMTWWNTLRNRYGLGEYQNIPSNWENLLLEERRHEFFCEFGHRFMDLKRTGKLSSIMLINKPQWKDVYKNFPIPEAELLLNPNLLPQNEGY